jgi:menaquinone-9 beta-reductase
MQQWDVIVVGGGPAGSTCARRLVDAGAKVCIVDAARFPRDKVCAGWITPQVVRALQLDVEAYRRGRSFQPITGFRVGSIGRRDAVSVPFGTEVSAGIRRCEFDEYLLVRSGAHLQCGAAVRSLRREHGAWVVNDQWSAPVLIGAGGSGCPVSRMLNGPVARGGPLVVAREAEFTLPAGTRRSCAVEPGVAEIYFTPDLVGYGWCVRKGDMLNIGIGRLDRRLNRGDVEAFAAFARQSRGVDAPGLASWRGHAYLAGAPRTQARTSDGVLLIGDAAGLASDRSGEGIGPAIESALMAASVIADAGADFGQARLARYDALVADRWQRPDPWSAIAGALPAAVVRPVVAPLLRTRAFVEGVVLNRWFLHANEPQWNAA